MRDSYEGTPERVTANTQRTYTTQGYPQGYTTQGYTTIGSTNVRTGTPERNGIRTS
jgi:hypothetical protein